MSQNVTLSDYIELSPIKSQKSKIVFDIGGVTELIAAVFILVSDHTSISSIIRGLPRILTSAAKRVDSADLVSAQGFVLYVTSLAMATKSQIAKHSPNLATQNGLNESLESVVLSALLTEKLGVDRRFFETPGLNPAFIRVREALYTKLNHRAIGLEEQEVESICNGLGAAFTDALYKLTQNIDKKREFKEFVSYFDENPFNKPMERLWNWDAYRAYLNKQLYSRLFLYEMEDHPSIALPDIYVSSRAQFYDVSESVHGEAETVKKVHADDAFEILNKKWLTTNIANNDHTRLLTGDPGTGKSTFSLHTACRLSNAGWRVIFIPANSIRSLELSFPRIVALHLQRVLHLDSPVNIDAEFQDPEGTGRPLLIVMDGLDEYDVGGETVSLAAARLVEHCMTVMDEWTMHGANVRLLICGRPEAASSLTTRFRKFGQHLHIIGFNKYDTNSEGNDFEFADEKSKTILEIDQRVEWWHKWQKCCGLPEIGLPKSIEESEEHGVLEITAQPLLNYMLAVLKLYDSESLKNLSSLYGSLFARYYERQSTNKSSIFEKICPNLQRFQRVMSEIGIAAWHAGDRSVSTEDLRTRFDRPPLKTWFEAAGQANRGLGAILSAFYTRPEDAANPQSGLAQRYVFTHKSFREYLTAVGIVRHLELMGARLDPDSEDGWSDAQALKEWIALFGPTALDERQWLFIRTELEARFAESPDKVLRIKASSERLFANILRRETVVPESANSLEEILRYVGNAEEAFVGVLDAIRQAINAVCGDRSGRINIDWVSVSRENGSLSTLALRELIARIKSRPGNSDAFLNNHIAVLFEIGSDFLNAQLGTVFLRRGDTWNYATSFDFTGMELSYSDFRTANLIYARFHRASGKNILFDESELHGANFSFASMGGDAGSFARANLSGTAFTSAQVRANFNGATLEGINLLNADIEINNIVEELHEDQFIIVGGSGRSESTNRSNSDLPEIHWGRRKLSMDKE